jgi:hypothetical protein
MLSSIFLGDQIKEGKMGAACRTHGGENKYIQSLVGESWKKEHLGDLGVEGKVILKLNLKE